MCIKHKESQILQLIRYEVMTCGSQNQTLYTSILYYNSNMLPLFHNVVFPGIELASQAAVLHSYAAKNGITPRKKKKEEIFPPSPPPSPSCSSLHSAPSLVANLSRSELKYGGEEVF